MYKCVAKTISPPFTICSSRRNQVEMNNIEPSYYVDVRKSITISEMKRSSHTDLNKYNTILRSLSDESSQPQNNVEDELSKKFSKMQVYNLDFDKCNFSVQTFNETITSVDREEIDYNGEIVGKNIDPNFSYLDKYGNFIELSLHFPSINTKTI